MGKGQNARQQAYEPTSLANAGSNDVQAITSFLNAAISWTSWGKLSFISTAMQLSFGTTLIVNDDCGSCSTYALSTALFVLQQEEIAMFVRRVLTFDLQTYFIGFSRVFSVTARVWYYRQYQVQGTRVPGTRYTVKGTSTKYAYKHLEQTERSTSNFQQSWRVCTVYYILRVQYLPCTLHREILMLLCTMHSTLNTRTVECCNQIESIISFLI